METVGGSTCHREWRQIGHSIQANFGNSLTHSQSRGERILTTMDSSIRKIQFLMLLPKIYPMLLLQRRFDTSKEEDEDKDEEEGVDNNPKTSSMLRPSETLLQNLQTLVNWLSSKKSLDTTLAGNGKAEPIPDERGHEGMCHDDEHEKMQDSFEKNKTLLQELASSRIFTPADQNDYEPNQLLSQVVKLLKLGLKSRYSSHIKEAYEKKDIQSLACILSITACTSGEEDSEVIAPTLRLNKKLEIETNLESSSFEHESNDPQEDLKLAMKNNSKHSIALQKILSSKSEDSQEDSHFSEVLDRVFTLLNENPRLFLHISKIMDELLQKEKIVIELDVVNGLRELFYEMKRLRVLVAHKLCPGMSLSQKQRLWDIKKERYKKYDEEWSKKIAELEKKIMTVRKKWDAISSQRNIDIHNLQEELRKVRENAETSLFKAVKELETEKEIQDKRHAQRLAGWEDGANYTESHLTDAILTLDEGYKALRSCRTTKETELHATTQDYKDSLQKLKNEYLEFLKIVQANDLQISKLEEFKLSMEDRYDEMKCTKRLKELLQKMQMAEAVKENWAARRIQSAWRRYKARKLKKRRLKKPKKRREGDRAGAGGKKLPKK